MKPPPPPAPGNRALQSLKETSCSRAAIIRVRGVLLSVNGPVLGPPDSQ